MNTQKQSYLAAIVRLGSTAFGDGKWVLMSLNTEEVLVRGTSKKSLEEYAVEHGFKVKAVLNDYN